MTSNRPEGDSRRVRPTWTTPFDASRTRGRAEPLRAARGARGRGAGDRRGGRRVGDHAHLSQLRLLLPPGLGPGAAARRRAELRGVRRADAAPALRRPRRTPRRRVRRVGRPRARARVPALARAAGDRHVPARRGRVRALERAPGRTVRRGERIVPALRGPRVRRLAVPGAGDLGGGVRGGGPRAVAAAGAARPGRACCGRRRGFSPASPGCGGSRASAGVSCSPPASSSRRSYGRWSTSSPPATRCTRCTRPPSSPTTSDASAASATSPARSPPSSRNTIRPPVAVLALAGALLGLARPRLARAARAAGAVRGRRDHVRRHRRARALDPAALPDGPVGRAVRVRRLRAGRIQRPGRGPPVAEDAGCAARSRPRSWARSAWRSSRRR